MREDDLLHHIRERSRGLASRFGSVLVGPGDDAAVVKPVGGEPLLITTDQLVEGRHFESDTDIDLIARKAVARSVSDICAMGGIAKWGLATAMLPEGYTLADKLFERVAAWAEHWGAPLVGGDIATTPGPLALGVTIAGDMAGYTKPVLRSGARAGDLIAVSGRIGGSFKSGRHLTFEPRVDIAERARRAHRSVTAMIDISDGLGIDSDRLARASNVCIEIDSRAIPLHDDAGGWREAISAGEDYELLIAFEAAREPLEGTTIIGVCVEADASGSGSVFLEGDERLLGRELGWDHGA